MLNIFEFVLDTIIMSFADELKLVKLRRTATRQNEQNRIQLLCPDTETYRQMMEETKLERYYHLIEQWTFKSRFVPLTTDQIRDLHLAHDHFITSSKTNDHEKTNECLQLFPSLLTLIEKLDTCDIQRPMFIRLSTRSPKDAALRLDHQRFRHLFDRCLKRIPIDDTIEDLSLHDRNRRLLALDEASIEILAVNDGFHGVQLLLASERIQSDLKDHDASTSTLNIIIRQYLVDENRCRSEFRAFIYDRKLTALTQYNEFVFDRELISKKVMILNSIRDFLDRNQILQMLPYENCVLDLVLVSRPSDMSYLVYICEINPLAEFAGTGLFSWLEDREILIGRRPFEFRIREIQNCDLQLSSDSHWSSLLESMK